MVRLVAKNAAAPAAPRRSVWYCMARLVGDEPERLTPYVRDPVEALKASIPQALRRGVVLLRVEVQA